MKTIATVNSCKDAKILIEAQPPDQTTASSSSFVSIFEELLPTQNKSIKSPDRKIVSDRDNENSLNSPGIYGCAGLQTRENLLKLSDGTDKINSEPKTETEGLLLLSGNTLAQQALENTGIPSKIHNNNIENLNSTDVIINSIEESIDKVDESIDKTSNSETNNSLSTSEIKNPVVEDSIATNKKCHEEFPIENNNPVQTSRDSKIKESTTDHIKGNATNSLNQGNVNAAKLKDKNDGTSVALQGDEMNNNCIMDKTAELDGQKLPTQGLELRVARSKADALSGDISTAKPHSENPGEILSQTVPDAINNANYSSSNVERNDNSTETGLHHIFIKKVSDEICELKRHSRESVTITIKPDVETSIHLDLQLRNNNVYVSAWLEKGDAGSLHSQWAELQRSFAKMGIQLGELSLSAHDQGRNRQDQFNRNGYLDDGYSGTVVLPRLSGEKHAHNLIKPRLVNLFSMKNGLEYWA